jgi:hypothetical protein
MRSCEPRDLDVQHKVLEGGFSHDERHYFFSAAATALNKSSAN